MQHNVLFFTHLCALHDENSVCIRSTYQHKDEVKIYGRIYDDIVTIGLVSWGKTESTWYVGH
jgi:hypothetical protein